MIIETLLNWLEAGVKALAALLPTWSGPNPFETWTEGLKNMAAINYFLPVSELFAFTVGVIVIFPILAGCSLAVWLIQLIRGSGS